jgi:putative endonuclease
MLNSHSQLLFSAPQNPPGLLAAGASSPNSSLPGLTRQSMLKRSMRTFWLYILANRARGTLYVGMTNDLIRRIYEHRAGLVEGFSKTYGVKMLVYYEEHATAIAAIQRGKTSNIGRGTGRSI